MNTIDMFAVGFVSAFVMQRLLSFCCQPLFMKLNQRTGMVIAILSGTYICLVAQPWQIVMVFAFGAGLMVDGYFYENRKLSTHVICRNQYDQNIGKETISFIVVFASLLIGSSAISLSSKPSQVLDNIVHASAPLQNPVPQMSTSEETSTNVFVQPEAPKKIEPKRQRQSPVNSREKYPDTQIG